SSDGVPAWALLLKGVEGRPPMTLLEFVVYLVIAGVCGAIARALAGGSAGGVILSILLGFLGAFVGTWLAPMFHLPQFLMSGMVLVLIAHARTGRPRFARY